MSKEAVNAASLVNLRPSLKAALKELAWYADKEGGNSYPGVATIAGRTGYSRRAVQKLLRELEQLGAIQAVGSRLGGRHRTTHYRLVLTWFDANCTRKGERQRKKGERHFRKQRTGFTRTE